VGTAPGGPDVATGIRLPLIVAQVRFAAEEPCQRRLAIHRGGLVTSGQPGPGGHDYVACAARAAEIGFAKEGNCFTGDR
jgi:hypothetical protein